ncbi:MAG: hypothetical protein RIS35_3358 [Pseudomonadota bacterium]
MSIAGSVWGLAACVLACLAAFDYVMNHLYVQGSGMLDVGWFVHLFSNAVVFPPTNPAVLGPGHYFSTHVSPIVFLTTFVHRGLMPGLGDPLFFSLVFAIPHGIVCWTVMAALRDAGVVARPIAVWLAPPVALLSAFNGVSLGALGFPHPEIAIPALLLAVLVLCVRSATPSACAVFCVLLSVREDAGLHAALLLGTICVALRIHRGRIPRSMPWLAFAGLLCSLITILVQKHLFGGDDAFGRIYAGPGPYDHLSAEFLFRRLAFFIGSRDYILLPWIVSLGLCLLRRNLIHLCGLVAVLPWALLSLTAIESMPGTLSNYYAFPMVVSMVWPILAGWLTVRLLGRCLSRAERTAMLLVPLLGIALFPSGLGHADPRPWRQFGFAHLSVSAATDDAVARLCRSKPALGRLLVDEPVSALMTACLHRGEWGYVNRFDPSRTGIPDTLVFLPGASALNGDSLPKMLEVAARGGIDRFRAIDGTCLVIGTRSGAAISRAGIPGLRLEPVALLPDPPNGLKPTRSPACDALSGRLRPG